MVEQDPTPREMLAAILQLGQSLNAKHVENKTELITLRKEVHDLRRAFPGGDPEGHRRYHESLIERLELRNSMIRAALVQAAKVGGLGAIGWVAYALWTAFKMELRK